MADVDVDQWLEGWAENQLPPGEVRQGADIRGLAEACASEAAAEGISMTELETAAGGPLDEYLRARQNARTDAPRPSSGEGTA